jgi:hypothetical protein
VYALGLEEVLLGFTKDATAELNSSEGNEREAGTFEGKSEIVL